MNMSRTQFDQFSELYWPSPSLTNKDRGDPCGRFYPGFKEAPQASERVF
jgi:hypothetical protein